MSRQDVYELMKDEKWHTLSELSKKLDKNKMTVGKSIGKLDDLPNIRIEKVMTGKIKPRKLYRMVLR